MESGIGKVRKTTMARRNYEESRNQIAFFQRLVLAENRYPFLKYVYSNQGGGNRNAITGAIMKAEGGKRGIPDVFIPIPRFAFHGAYLEFKVVGRKPSKEQLEFMKFAAGQGFACAIVYSVDQAVEFTEKYLDIKL